MANVFISHRQDDIVPAERLAEELRCVGHIVWLDIWEIKLGDSIIGRMNEGLADSTYVVVCYSASGVNTPWMSREWMSALAAQLNGRGVKVLPVILTGGEPPAILADVKHADLTQDWRSGVDELLSAMA